MLLQMFAPAFIWLNIFQNGQKSCSMVAFILPVVKHGTIFNVFGCLLVSIFVYSSILSHIIGYGCKKWSIDNVNIVTGNT